MNQQSSLGRYWYVWRSQCRQSKNKLKIPPRIFVRYIALEFFLIFYNFPECRNTVVYPENSSNKKCTYNFTQAASLFCLHISSHPLSLTHYKRTHTFTRIKNFGLVRGLILSEGKYVAFNIKTFTLFNIKANRSLMALKKGFAAVETSVCCSG